MDAGKSEELLNSLHIAVRKNANEFKSFDTILKSIKAKWGEWSSITKQNVAQTIAGTYHYSKFIALMENMDIATGATTKALNSNNSAMNENAKYLRSIEGRMQVLGTTIEDLYKKIISSDFIKFIVDVAIKIADFLSSANGLRIILSILAGVMAGVLVLAITSTISAVASLITSIQLLIAEGITLNALLGGLPLIIGAIVTVTAFATNGFGLFNQEVQKTNDGLEVVTRTWQEMREEAEKTKETIDKHTSSLEGEILIAQKAVGILEGLTNQTKLTTFEKTQMKIAVDKLNSVIPNLNLAIDATTGKLNMETSAIRSAIAAYKEYIYVQAAQESAKAAATRAYEAQFNIEKMNKEGYTEGSDGKIRRTIKMNNGKLLWNTTPIDVDENNQAAKAYRENQKIIKESEELIEKSFKLSEQYEREHGSPKTTPQTPETDYYTPKKDSSSGTYASGVSANEALITRDRYFLLNQELDRNNTLLEKNKALQENATNSEKNVLLEKEIALLKKKQDAVHNIAEEERAERLSIAKSLSLYGAKFSGSGDSAYITNMDDVLEAKRAQVNAHRKDKNKNTYNTLKAEYEQLETLFKRFYVIQDDIVKQQTDWTKISTDIAGVLKEQIQVRIDILEDALNKLNDYTLNPLNDRLDEIDYNMQMLADDDVTGKVSLLNEKLSTQKDKVIQLEFLLNTLKNTETKSAEEAKYLADKMKEVTNELRNAGVEAKNTTDSLANLAKEQKDKADKLIESYKEYLQEELQSKIDALEEEKNTAKETSDKIIEGYQAQIDALEKNNDLLKEQTELQEKLNELAKQKQLLENIKKDRNVQIYRAGQGFVWEADPRKLREETDKLIEMQTDFDNWSAEKARQREIDLLKEKIETERESQKITEESYNNQINSLKDNLQKQAKLLNTDKTTKITTIKQLYSELSKIDSAYFKDSLGELQTFVNKWNSIMLTLGMPGIDLSSFLNKFNLNNEYSVYSKDYQGGTYSSGYTQGLPSSASGGEDFTTPSNYTSQSSNKTIGQTVDYSKVTFDKNENIQATIDSLKSSGASAITIANKEKERAAKIYSDPTLTAKYGDTIPTEYQRGFDNGGMSVGRGYMLKDIVEPEWTLNPEQSKSFIQIIKDLPYISNVMDKVSNIIAPKLALSTAGIGGDNITNNNFHIDNIQTNDARSFLEQAKRMARSS